MYNTKNRCEQGQALRKEIYMYIVSYIKLVGYAPSITEISERWMPGELRSGNISIS